ncbi:hypothetical protein SAMN05519104_5148 [Rhizobiales bacterium GAS188]|nr:hypothetical protein SAMN05519104_5148 [Rhizobiales bacterium GAS188]
MALADRALVVGINRYPAIGSLQGAEADALDFHAWVTDPAGGGVAPAMAQLILSREGASPKVKDAEPARYQIERFFTDIDECANENNGLSLGLKAGRRLYMFFSGHGFAPSYDRSAVLMANTTLTLLDNVAGRLWADRLFQGGWFDEVLLFQDACRSSVGVSELMPPFLKPRVMPGRGNPWRFYAFSAKDGKVALEKPNGAGQVRGIFTSTLMEGLRGAARDPATGDITSAQLKAYLQKNMKAKLSPTELQNDDIAQDPDVFDPDPCVIVKAPVVAAAIRKFPVRITLSAAGLQAHIEDSSFAVVEQGNGAQVWNLQLAIGIYKLVVAGQGTRLFEVSGALRPDGSGEVVNVSIP